MITDSDRVPLGARAWIADGTRGALVAADGTIDWYCPDRFDQGARLFRILDGQGGYLRVGQPRTGTGAGRRLPAGEQHYVARTNVADLVLHGGGAAVRVCDLLPWPGPNERAPGRIVRLITALAGPVEVELELMPGTAFGPSREVSSSPDGAVFDRGAVHAGFPLLAVPVDRDHTVWRGVRHLDAGESMVVTVDDLDALEADRQPLSVDAAQRLAESTAQAWRSWLAPLTYSGPYLAAVERSLLALKSLTGYQVGAPVAAGTTSLPRRSGGQRTSDDRFLNLRDAAAAATVLASVGFDEDAEAAERWLREAVEGSSLPWPTALDVDAEAVPSPPVEWALDGWRRSQPVLTGRDGDRLDLDVYGDVAAAISVSTGETGGAGPLAGAWPALVAATDWLADHWGDPDHGVWALAGRPEMLVSSRLSAWRALDRMTRLARAANPLDLTAAAWHQESRRVLTWLEHEAVAPDGGLRRVAGGDRRAGNGADATAPDDRPDAALLRVASSGPAGPGGHQQGPWPAGHPLVGRTVERVLERLSSGPWVYRYGDDVDDGRPGADNPDLQASLWAVRALAALERWEEAHERMEQICASGGRLGVLSQAVEPLSGELMGNLPAAGVHLALIDAAVALEAGPR